MTGRPGGGGPPEEGRPDTPTPAEEQAGAAPPGRRRSALVQFTSTILVLEAVVVGFAAVVAHGLDLATPGVRWAVFGGTGLSLLIAAGLVRRPWGVVVGSVLQVAVLVLGVAIPMMFFVGGIFVVLWVVAVRLGQRIDRERAERAAGEGGETPDGP